MSRTCESKRKDGKPCSVQALPGDKFCFAHSAGTAEKRRAAYSTGGKQRANAARAQKALPPDLRQLLTLLLEAIPLAQAGTLPPAAASAMASLAGAAVRVYGVCEVEERIRAIEARMGGRKDEHA